MLDQRKEKFTTLRNFSTKFGLFNQKLQLYLPNSLFCFCEFLYLLEWWLIVIHFLQLYFLIHSFIILIYCYIVCLAVLVFWKIYCFVLSFDFDLAIFSFLCRWLISYYSFWHRFSISWIKEKHWRIILSWTLILEVKWTISKINCY